VRGETGRADGENELRLRGDATSTGVCPPKVVWGEPGERSPSGTDGRESESVLARDEPEEDEPDDDDESESEEESEKPFETDPSVGDLDIVKD
jgi:hypothetical protein